MQLSILLFTFIRKKIILTLYSIPHFNLTITGLPVRPLKKGFGFKGSALDIELPEIVILLVLVTPFFTF